MSLFVHRPTKKTSDSQRSESMSSELKEYAFYDREQHCLYVSESHRHHPLVSSYVARLKRLRSEPKISYVELTEISKLHADSRVNTAHLENSDMQRYAKSMFERATALRASDIHIRCDSTKTTILFRVNGDLEEQEEHPFTWGDQLCRTIYQAMTNISDSSFEPNSRQDARISDKEKMPSVLAGIRVATTPQSDGYVMVLRLLYNETSNQADLKLESLGYGSSQAKIIELQKRNPTGINVIAGPTGSGKSTTLKTILLSMILETKGRKHIITVEDPPEYPIPGAVQTPVANAETEEERNRAFQAAIKAGMRLDPDIMMIGEIRDGPSAQLALRAAMTGHQVWTTIHANGALAILDRLLDLGVPMDMLSDHTIITGLTCQRLVKVLCPGCKVSISSAVANYSPGDIERIKAATNYENVFVTGPGCEHPGCRKTGSVDRTIVTETIATDPQFMQFIRNRDKQGAMHYWLAEKGGITMSSHAIEKVNLGIVDPFAAEQIVGQFQPQKKGHEQ